MSSANNNMSSDGRNHGGDGGQSRKRNSEDAGVDQSALAWSLLDESYRVWLVARRLAVNAETFSALSPSLKLIVIDAYNQQQQDGELRFCCFLYSYIQCVVRIRNSVFYWDQSHAHPCSTSSTN
jgi:hypothetical protein